MRTRETLLRSLRPYLATVALLGALAPLAPAGWWDDLDKGESVRLSDVFASPQSYEGRSVTFACILFGKDDVYFPLHTPFTEATHDDLSVWPDGAPVWEEATFKQKVLPYLYVDRHHPARDELLRLEQLTRIEVTARIRTIWRGVPYLDLVSWRRTGWRLGLETVREVRRGDVYVQQGQPEIALGAYRRALRPDLAPVYAVQVRKKIAGVLRSLGREAEAVAFESGETPLPATSEVVVPVAPSTTAPPPSGPVTEDLPGTPVGPAPTTRPSDLPGAPAEAVPAVVPPGPPPAVEAPAQPPLRVPTPRIPPRRNPRLDGVK